MEVKDLIPILEKAIKDEKESIKELKMTIPSHYTLAKLQFNVIDNKEDSLITYEKMLEMAKDLQQRIIDRNRI